MKLILQITAGILIAGLIGWMAVDYTGFRHAFFDYSDQEIKQSEQEFDTKVAQVLGHPVDETPAQAEARDVAYGAEAIEGMYGKKMADRYRNCHASKTLPKTEQAWCTKMDKRLGIGKR